MLTGSSTSKNNNYFSNLSLIRYILYENFSYCQLGTSKPKKRGARKPYTRNPGTRHQKFGYPKSEIRILETQNPVPETWEPESCVPEIRNSGTPNPKFGFLNPETITKKVSRTKPVLEPSTLLSYTSQFYPKNFCCWSTTCVRVSSKSEKKLKLALFSLQHLCKFGKIGHLGTKIMKKKWKI